MAVLHILEHKKLKKKKKLMTVSEFLCYLLSFLWKKVNKSLIF